MAFKFGDFFPRSQLNLPGLDLDDNRWADLEGGYRNSPLDASVNLKMLERAKTLEEMNAVYGGLWNDLHHQGDVGVASYYSVPHLVRIAKRSQLIDFNVFSMVTVIEIQRHKDGNPAIPKALLPAYQKAIADVGELALLFKGNVLDLETTLSILSAIALAKGQLKLAELMLDLDKERMDALWGYFRGDTETVDL